MYFNISYLTHRGPVCTTTSSRSKRIYRVRNHVLQGRGQHAGPKSAQSGHLKIRRAVGLNPFRVDAFFPTWKSLSQLLEMKRETIQRIALFICESPEAQTTKHCETLWSAVDSKAGLPREESSVLLGSNTMQRTFPRKAYSRMHGTIAARTWATDDVGSDATANRKFTYSVVALTGGGFWL